FHEEGLAYGGVQDRGGEADFAIVACFVYLEGYGRLRYDGAVWGDHARVGGVRKGDNLEGLTALWSCGAEEELNGAGFPEGQIADDDVCVADAQSEGDRLGGDVELTIGYGVARPGDVDWGSIGAGGSPHECAADLAVAHAENLGAFSIDGDVKGRLMLAYAIKGEGDSD